MKIFELTGHVIVTILLIAGHAACAGAAPVDGLPSDVEVQIVQTLAHGISKDNVAIVVAEAGGSGPMGADSVIPEETPGYMGAVTEFSLTPFRTQRIIKGKVDRRFFVQHPTDLSELSRRGYLSLQWHPDSQWLLLLKTPLAVDNAQYARVAGQVDRLGARDYLTESTFFTVFDQGFGALCLGWEPRKSMPEGLYLVPRGVTGDIEFIVKYVERIREAGDDYSANQTPKSQLTTSIGQQVYELLFGAKPEGLEKEQSLPKGAERIH
ncbi:MAG: hypothetical protein KKC76_08290 [Proteobacteria bacterium]|nr:hypothetical protein [Pseudomonadota bacterium]MBU4298070.1 hypothetical protein [Pseudomonadota bacterium]MCG2746306.1 hypothetical protein [Desulfobulbaceae bacterium]